MKRPLLTICLVGAALLLNGCGRPSFPPATSLSEAHQKLARICKEDTGVDVQLVQTGQTLWIYVPLTESLMGLKASPSYPLPKDKASLSMSLLFFDSAFRDREFIVRYDIDRVRKYMNDPGYTSAYSEDFRTLQRKIITAVYRAFGGMPATPDKAQDVGNDIGTVKKPAPDFFVVAIADITTGIIVQGTLYLEDLMRAMSNPPSISHEEYIKRYVSDIYGSEGLIGDRDGKNLERHDVTMGEFLARQIETRVKFKYTQSAFPPGPETQNEILGIAARTLTYYDFNDYDAVKLVDLGMDETMTVARDKIAR